MRTFHTCPGWCVSALLAAGGLGAACSGEVSEAGADVDVQDDRGMTALMYAARHVGLDRARKLLAAGANVMLRDHQGQTAADLARNRGNRRNRRNRRNNDIVALLEAAEADRGIQ